MIYGVRLLLVLVDFLEVLIGIYLELAAGGFVAGDDAVLVELESADGPGVVNATLYAMAQGACLIVAADEKENLLGITDGAYANRERGLRNLIGIVIEEAGVGDKGVGGKGANTCSGGQ